MSNSYVCLTYSLKKCSRADANVRSKKKKEKKIGLLPESSSRSSSDRCSIYGILKYDRYKLIMSLALVTFMHGTSRR